MLGLLYKRTTRAGREHIGSWTQRVEDAVVCFLCVCVCVRACVRACVYVYLSA